MTGSNGDSVNWVSSENKVVKFMKVCVFSDSHGYTGNMTAAIELERPDMCFFLGDGERDIARVMEKYPEMPVYVVRGNCDLWSKESSAISCEIEGVKIFATHGHLSYVKHDFGFETLTSQALEEGADIALFGHTHRQHLSESYGVTLLNPGSIGQGYYPGYAVLTIQNGKCRPELKAI